MRVLEAGDGHLAGGSADQLPDEYENGLLDHDYVTKDQTSLLPQVAEPSDDTHERQSHLTSAEPPSVKVRLPQGHIGGDADVTLTVPTKDGSQSHSGVINRP